MRNIYYGFISGNVLKLIACAAMLIDHIGVFLFPDVLWLRLVGRVAMPLFAFTLAEGCFYTRSKLRHTLLIAGLGLVTSGVASFVTGTVEGDILITFTLSCLIIWALDALKMACFALSEAAEGQGAEGGISGFWKRKPVRITLSALALCIAVGGAVGLTCFSGIHIEYGLAGVLLPVTVHLPDFRKAGEGGARLAFLYTPATVFALFSLGLVVLSLVQGWAQWFSLAAMLPILFYSGERGKRKLKYLFYIFYPAHLAVLGGIAMLMRSLPV